MPLRNARTPDCREAGGLDLALLYDSAGNDVFVSRPTVSLLRAAGGFVAEAAGFAAVSGRSTAGGFDQAFLEDTAGNDTLGAAPTQVNLAGPAGLYLQTLNFDQVVVTAANGGTNDRAFLNDSPGNDLFVGEGFDGRLTGPGYDTTVRRFTSVAITGTTGTNLFDVSNLSYAFTRVGPWTEV